MTNYTNKDRSIRFTGRWDLAENGVATTTTPGAYFEFSFIGKTAILNFDINRMVPPFPHLYIIIDNGAKIETAVDAFLRIETETEGWHYLKVIFKSAVEDQHRWYQPLEGKISLKGIEAEEAGILPDDNRKIIEFIGDSITEGVLIDYDKCAFQDNNTYNRPYQDDSTATYAYLTAQKLNMKPVIIGYGAVGITRSGSGSVPKVLESYPYNFCGSPIMKFDADCIVINHGANDVGNSEQYIMEYYDFLKLVREKNPGSIINVLSPFCGFMCEELEKMVSEYNQNEGDSVIFISSIGWVPPDPLHPLRDGHIIISEHLTAELKKHL